MTDSESVCNRHRQPQQKAEWLIEPKIRLLPPRESKEIAPTRAYVEAMYYTSVQLNFSNGERSALLVPPPISHHTNAFLCIHPFFGYTRSRSNLASTQNQPSHKNFRLRRA